MKISEQGFTLIEAVIVIAITGIIAAVVAVFIKAPVDSYFDTARRAEMTDIADTALRRMSRDLHLALPNSVRVGGVNKVIEFLQTRAGGRYRVEQVPPGTGDILDFTLADTSFDLLGPAITFKTGDQIVIYNLGTGITGADAYSGNSAATDNRRAYNGAAGSTNSVQITSGAPFPFDSPNHSFQVVEGPVSYFCDPVGTRTLTRYWGYAIQSPQLVTANDLDTALTQPSTSASKGKAVLANNVRACNFVYTAGVTEHSGLISMQLSITQSGETVNLYHEVHVSNVP